MASSSATAPPRGIDAATTAEAFLTTSGNHAKEVAIRTKGDEQTLTWEEWRDRSSAIAGGLAALGTKRGDTGAIMLANRPEFHLVDVGAVLLGAAAFSIYQTYAPGQI